MHRTSSFVKNDAELFGPFRSRELFGGPAPQGVISTWSMDLPPSARSLSEEPASSLWRLGELPISQRPELVRYYPNSDSL